MIKLEIYLLNMTFIKNIGIIGFGSLGQFLVKNILESPSLKLVFVWNRSPEILTEKVPDHLVITDLCDINKLDCDLVIEVAHPNITQVYGELILQHCDYLIGSPTCLADPILEENLQKAAIKYGHVVYLPTGAFWGSEDVRTMAERGTLKSLKVTMSKHPDSLKVLGDLVAKKERAKSEKKPVVIYEGPVRQLCPLAPNNVNCMAAASIAASNLGLDKTQGCLIADVDCAATHVMTIELEGENGFSVTTKRTNPAQIGSVTGQATLTSFLSSIKKAHGKEPGFQLC